MLATGTRARFYIILRDGAEVALPAYVRLGKFMSKARLDAQEVSARMFESAEERLGHLMNGADLLASDYRPRNYSMLNIPPSPLLRGAAISGALLEVSDDERGQIFLPAAVIFAPGAADD